MLSGDDRSRTDNTVKHTDFDAPSDPRVLGLENQLLKTEVAVLRSRLAGVDDEIGAIQRQLDIADLALKGLQDRIDDAVLLSPDNYEDLRQAKRDLRWILRRLVHSPLGPILSRRSGFSSLIKRHLSDSEQ